MPEPQLERKAKTLFCGELRGGECGEARVASAAVSLVERERRAKEESLANEGAKNSLLGGGRPFSKVRRVV